MLADWRKDGSTGVAIASDNAGAEALHDQWPEHNAGISSRPMDVAGLSRLSAEELDQARGQELRDWKEQRVDEAVALIRVGSIVHDAHTFSSPLTL